MKLITSKSVLLVCGILIALFIAETIIRCFRLAPVMLDYNIIYNHHFVDNPKICYKIKPLANKEINSEGFMDEEFVLKKDRNLVRIIMLGDSITYGVFVNRKQAFPDVLEKTLNLKSQFLPSPVKYDVMNFGVGGYNIISEVEVLRLYGLKYKPDIVVLNYFWNDNKIYSFDYWSFLKRKDVSLAEKNWAYQYYLYPERFRWRRLFFRSHLFVYIWSIVSQLQEHFLDSSNVEYAAYKNDIVSEKLMELKKMGADYNFKILICMHPILDYDKNEPHANYAKTKKTAEKLGIPCFDLLPYYLQQSDKPGKFLVKEKDVFHPNAAGHSLIARSLELELVKIGYIRLEN
ncbi:MAG: GDSL-type esterase/lipase family protein [Candidatus Omnitrophota bacterium]